MSRRNNDFIEVVAGLILICCIVAGLAIYKLLSEDIWSLVIVIGVVAVILLAVLFVIRDKGKGVRSVGLEEEQKRGDAVGERLIEQEKETAQISPEHEKIDWYEQSRRDWRRVEKMDEFVELFPVCDERYGVFSPYQVDVTYDERRIFDAIIDKFNPHCIFVDTYFKKADGKTAQIDIIAICKRGIIVIESKGYNGWIFGNANSQRWTQVLAYGHEKYQFYNPIKQNASHIATLRKVINTPGAKFFSLVVFSDGAEIKSADFIPKNCYVLTAHRIFDVLSEIFFEPEMLSNKEVVELANKVRKARIIPNNAIRQGHVQGIKDSLGTDRIFQ